ncbi:hypothetical protein ATANTOWER_015683 [Ataeniobius toweri]|uniref:Secreted protein n=1 Tax=Ataeniobius toweri TaxID=208326 RepID=A0ABU7CBV1_9TELE|nr:hypothetical protein [Ataeniobius toweri]
MKKWPILATRGFFGVSLDVIFTLRLKLHIGHAQRDTTLHSSDGGSGSGRTRVRTPAPSVSDVVSFGKTLHLPCLLMVARGPRVNDCMAAPVLSVHPRAVEYSVKSPQT